MSVGKGIEESGDRAWVDIPTRWPRDSLRALIEDVELMFRINPLLEIDSWNEGEFAGRNLGNGRAFRRNYAVRGDAGGVDVIYADGLKSFTRFEIGPGGTLRILEDYGRLPEAERKARLEEIDPSLVPWGRALQDYLETWRRWSWCPPWRWYMARIWRGMKPKARRIAFMLWLIGALEFLAFLAVLAVFLAGSN